MHAAKHEQYGYYTSINYFFKACINLIPDQVRDQIYGKGIGYSSEEKMLSFFFYTGLF